MTPTPDLTVRPLGADDAEAGRRLGFEAFGMPATPPTDPAPGHRPGRNDWGAFDADRLAAKLSDREYHSWFGGAEIPTAGIAGVTVAVEYRGAGALGPLMAAALRAARERGAVLSTLFPTAPRIYRRFSYELVGDFATVAVPTALLAQAAAPVTQVRLRRAAPADVGEIDRVYTAWAAAQNGPLTRHGTSFPASAEEYVAGFDGITLALDPDGTVIGFASWDRGQGYRQEAFLAVSDLLALTADGYRALLRALGSFASVTGLTRIDTSGDDVVRLFLPVLRWDVVESNPYMLSVLDVVGAVEPRAFPKGLDVDVSFEVVGHVLGEIDGGYRLLVSGGQVECTRVDGAAAELDARGLALLYAGAQSSANLRMSGLLRGGSPADDSALDAAFGGRPLHIRDYF